MCFPPAVIAAFALTGLGGGLSYMGQRKAEKAKTRTFMAERGRQKAFEGEQQGRFEDSLDSTRKLFDPAAQADAVAAREAALTAATKSAAPAAEGYLPGSGSAPAIVATAGEQAGASADAGTSRLAHALASLGGTSDQLFNNDIRIGRNSQTIGQLGGFKRGSLDILQSEMDAAAQKGKTLRTIGGLAKTIGSMMLTAGVGGAPVGAAAANTGAAAGTTMSNVFRSVPVGI